MGLKTDIYNALKANVEPDNPGQNYKFNDGGKLDKLATALEVAIAKFMTEQTFRVTKLNASTGKATTAGGMMTAGPPAPHTIPAIPIPMITVEMDEQGQGVGNPNAGGKPESLKSEVKLREVSYVDEYTGEE